MERRILITGVGRRVEFIQALRSAANQLNIKLIVTGTDISDLAPALLFCDNRAEICPMDSAGYTDRLLEICLSEQIDMVIPTLDTDLRVLAADRKRFEEAGTRVLVSSIDVVETAADKLKSAELFKKLGLNTPEIYKDEVKFPCFVKKRFGSGSKGAAKICTEEELEIRLAEDGENILIQQFIDGMEYTVDVFCTMDGEPIYITPRKRIEVRCGEVQKTETDLDERIISECRKITEKLKPTGPLTIQLIRREIDGVDFFTEINARFAGGSPLSMKAGADSASALLEMMSGRTPACGRVTDGARYSRFDTGVCVNKGISDVKGIIFDMDDTLYPEKDYVRNGYDRAAAFLSSLLCEYAGTAECSAKQKNILAGWTKPYIEDRLWTYFLEYKPAIDYVLRELFRQLYLTGDGPQRSERHEKRIQIDEDIASLSTDRLWQEECDGRELTGVAGMGMDELRDRMLAEYRDLKPHITPFPGVEDMLIKLKINGYKLGLITDGHVINQNAKLDALGLRKYFDDILVTDELGGTQFRKPCDITYRIIQNRWRIPFEELVYIGDNLSKDFVAPGQLGMQSVYFRNTEGIYYRGWTNPGIPEINTVTDLLKLVKIHE